MICFSENFFVRKEKDAIFAPLYAIAVKEE